MSKAEEFIQQNTKRCSEGVRPFEEWLTPYQARRAVEIAREETIKEVCEWLCNHYRDYMHNPTGKQLEAFLGMDMITDLKQAMRDENTD